MPSRSTRSGRPAERRPSGTRQILAGAAVAVAVAGLLLLILGPRRVETPGPLLRERPGVRGAAALAADTAPPREPVAILFFQGRPTAPLPDGRRMVVAEGGRLLTAGNRPTLDAVPLGVHGGVVIGAAPATRGGWWLSLLDGTVVNHPAGSAPGVRSAPFPASFLWAGAAGRIWVARSPERFGFAPEPEGRPVVASFEDDGRIGPQLGRAVVPEHALLATLANTGYIAAVGDTVYYAPLSRSEVQALGPRGDTLWIAAAPPGAVLTPEPRFVVRDGRVAIDYQPFNLALTVGPSGLIYRLRVADTAGLIGAVDVIDPASGRLLGTAPLPSTRANLAVNARGRLYLFNEGTALGAAGPGERPAFPPFDLPARGGGRLASARFAGRVTLVNLWASWCAPCRTEMPALDSLARRLAGDRFAFVALSADADQEAADRFLGQLGFTFPVAYGGPGLERTYHYPGLPYTVLLDGNGRVIRRWIGQLAGRDLEQIALLAAAEAGAGPAPETEVGHHHHAEENH